jgi:OOP family OmpA-OmpF porin
MFIYKSSIPSVIIVLIVLSIASCKNQRSSELQNSGNDDTGILLDTGESTPRYTPFPGDLERGNRKDLLTFAQGAIPLHITGDGAGLGANFEHAVRAIDGSETPYTFVSQAGSETVTEFIYALPASTRFDRFAVPEILEIPSPIQTFTKHVEIWGSATGYGTGFELLASASLLPHNEKGDITELRLISASTVKWIKLVLRGGIDIQNDLSSFSFSEIIGNGTQETPDLADHFTGVWDPPGPPIKLKQDGPSVTGCYDVNGLFQGTVTGNILRGQGTNTDDGVMSLFILSVTPDGNLRGVRSTNAGPFRFLNGPASPNIAVPNCEEPAVPDLGCGSIVYGIQFDYDSDVIRSESHPILEKLYEGLKNDNSSTIIIEGHTSDEGSEEYNKNLAERRAQSVVDELVSRGLAAARIQAFGIGEIRPVVSNWDEHGRSMNRRVEVKCQ